MELLFWPYFRLIDFRFSFKTDPLAKINNEISDLEEKLLGLKKKTAIAITDEKRLRKTAENFRQTVDEWEGKADLAARAGSDDKHQLSLGRIAEYQSQFTLHNRLYERQRGLVDRLKQRLQTTNYEIQQLTAQAWELKVQQTEESIDD
jgi:phage shock protein A